MLNGARSPTYPHDGYVCNRCNVGGHLIKDCPGIFGTSGFAHPSLSQHAPADRIAKEVRDYAGVPIDCFLGTLECRSSTA